MTKINVYDYDADRLEELAEEMDCTIADIIEEALEDYILSLDKKEYES